MYDVDFNFSNHEYFIENKRYKIKLCLCFMENIRNIKS
jgi:hypothetical protein